MVSGRRRFSAGLVLVCWLSTAVWSQPSPRVRELLALPAAEKWVAEDRQPTEDDRIFWEWGSSRIPARPITAEQQELLWAACQRHPEKIQAVRKYLPDRPEVDRLVFANISRYDRDTRRWLSLRGRFLKSDLVAHAAKGSEPELLALIRFDPKAARAILDRLKPGPALVARVLLEPGRSDLRQQLQTLASNSKVPAGDRDFACKVLGRLRWPDQEQFMHGLWAKIPGGNVDEGYFRHQLLRDWVSADPDRWIPLMVTWLRDSDRVVRNNAVECLVQFQLEDCREDALKPLLPWLANPNWSQADDRLRLIQSLDRFECPDAVPGLIAVVASKSDEYERSYAAETLAHYRDPSALPAVRAALSKEKDGGHRERYIQALVACGGVDEAAQLTGLESYAAYLQSHGEMGKWGDDAFETDFNTSLGAYLARHDDLSTAVLTAVSQRITSLRMVNKPLALALEEMFCDWDDPVVEEYLLSNLLSNQADIPVLREIMKRRLRFGEKNREQLLKSAHGPGELAGFCAALLADSEVCGQILQTGDDSARNGLLALARLNRVELDPAKIAPLLSNPITREASEAYLLVLDSPEARLAMQGEGLSFGLSGGELKKITPAWEARFRKELKESPEIEEIYALLTTGYYESYGHFVVRVTSEGAMFSWTGGGQSYRRRSLSAKEWRRLHEFVTQRNVDSWPKLNDVGGHNCEYQYLHITRTNGYRVYAWNPQPQAEEKRYWELTQIFKNLLSGPTELRYRVMDEIPEAQVLLDSESRHVEATEVFGDGAGVAIKVTAPMQLEPALLRSDAFRRFGLKPGGGAWYSQGMNRRAAPEGLLVDDHSDLSNEDLNLNSPSWACQTPNGRVRVIDRGLFLVDVKKRRRKLAEGVYGNPIVSADGRWVLVAKAEENWGPPNSLVRLDLKTGKGSLVDIDPADNLDCLAFVPERGFLVRSVKDETPYHNLSRGPDTPQYNLVDPETGKVQPIAGEFGPYVHRQTRAWQPTGQPGQYWAARTTEKGTEVGRYTASDFAFTPVRTYPRVFVDSSQIWIDEPNHHAYICVSGDLLELPW